MATVPVTRVWSAGEVVTQGYMNDNVTAPIGWLLAKAICRVRQTVAQSIPNNSSTAITFDAEDVDSTGMHSTVSNTDRLTAVYPGWHSTGGAYCSAASTAGIRATQIDVNGTVLNGSDIQGAPTSSGVSITAARRMLAYLNVGDYLRLRAFHTIGSATNTGVTTSNQSSFDVTWESN